MADHAKLSPSASSRWLVCTASVKECEGREQTTSKYAEEGTLAHSLLEKQLNPDAPDVPQTGVTVDMLNAVKVATDWVEDILKRYPDAIVLTETQVDASALLMGPVWGTADILIWAPGIKTLFVADYKHGKGIPVEVKHNTQLQIYAIGAIASMEWMFEGVETVMSVVIQPRADHPDGVIRTEPYEVDTLKGIAESMSESVIDIAEGKTRYVPNETTCRWCLAKHECPALSEKVQEVVPFDSIPTKEEVTQAVEAADDHQLLRFHKMRPLLKTWMDAMEAHLVDQIMKGNEVPGLKVVEGRSNRKWADPEEAAEKLRTEVKLRKGEVFTEKLVTPAAVEKILKGKPKRGLKAKQEALAALITKPPGKPTVVADSDKRESIALPSFDPVKPE